MPRRATVPAGMGLAAIIVGLLTAGCLPASPPAPASLTVSPSQLTFQAVHSSFMPTQEITVTNTGGRSVRSLMVNPVGVYSLPQPPTTPCLGPGSAAVLAPGQSCLVDVQFCPSTVGPDLKTLVVTGQDASSGSLVQITVALNGTAT